MRITPITVMLTNIAMIASCTIAAVHFDKWWIILFALLSLLILGDGNDYIDVSDIYDDDDDWKDMK